MDDRIPVYAPDGAHIGYVAPVRNPYTGVERWHSWRPDAPLDHSIGSHQDQGQAERFLAQLAGGPVAG